MTGAVTPIRAVREERNLSIEGLARRADLSIKTVYRAERGMVVLPHWRTRRRLAEALGVAEQELWPELAEGAAA